VEREELDKMFKELSKMDPAPVITITARVLGEDKKYHLHKRTGVFGWWNGLECSFTARKPKAVKSSGTVTFFMPFCADNIVSVEIATEEELIASQNLLFEIEEQIREKNGE